MANYEHIDLLKQGPHAWNKWRRTHPNIQPDLSGTPPSRFKKDLRTLEERVINLVTNGRGRAGGSEFSELDLTRINLSRANLAYADFNRTTLTLANLAHAKLQGANLSGCILTHADLRCADLRDTNLDSAILRWANLSKANLRNCMLPLANLDGAIARGADFHSSDLVSTSIVGADFSGADLTGSFVYGISAWNVNLHKTIQNGLVITRTNEPLVTVDDLQVAQFIYLLLNNKNVKAMVDTITTKMVLVLGRFTPQRKAVLDAVRIELRRNNYVPMLFDFERPVSRDFTETIVTLAHMARFIIADLTDPASLPKELEAIVPRLAIPVLPLLAGKSRPYAMFGDYWKYDWVLKLRHYVQVKDLLSSFKNRIIAPAEQKAIELTKRRAMALDSR